MRALRSRTVQSDEDFKNNEQEIENLEQAAIKHISKNIRKKSRKHTHDENNEPEKVQSAGYSGFNEHEGEDSGSTTEKNNEKVKRKKLKKRNHDKSNSNSDNVFNELEKEELSNSSEKNISNKVKRKKCKKHKHENNLESDKERNDSDSVFIKQESEEWSNSSEKNFPNKIKRKCLKKRKHDKNNSELDKVQSDGVGASTEHERENLGDSIEKNISKKVKRKKLKKSKHDENHSESTRVRSAGNSLSNELGSDHLEHSSEKNISTKKKQKKLTKLTHNENDLGSDKVQSVDSLLNHPEREELGHSIEKNSSRKDKRKKVKAHEDINPELDKVQEEKDMKKKKSKKSKRSKGDNSIDSTIRASDIETDTKVLNISTKSPPESDKSLQKSRKLRMRSTILNSPDFTNVITSTVLKPRRPEILLKNGENVDLENNFTVDQKTNKIRPNQRKQSLSDRTDTFDKNSKKRSLTVAENYITTRDKNNDLENNCSVFQNSNEIRHSQRKKSMLDRSESLNKSSKKKSLSATDNSITIGDKNIDDYSVFQKSNEMRHSQRKKSLSSRRETFQLSKTKNLPVVENSIITIEDTLEESTFNKINTLQPEITSNEYETNITLEMKNKLSNSELYEQNLGQSTSKLNLSTKNDTFNKTPKTVSSRKSKRLSDKPINDSYVYPNLKEDSKYDRLSNVNESILDNIVDLTYSPDIKQNTFNLSNNVANSTITKSNTRSKSNDTFEIQIVNTSGDWQVNNNQTKMINVENNKLNDTFEIDNKENDTESPNSTIILNENITFTNENVSPSLEDKNTLRKKWLKYARHSSDAQSVLEQISSPRLKKKMIVEKNINTSKDLQKLQKPSVAPSNLSIQKNSVKKLPISLKKSLPKLLQQSAIISKSEKKSVPKRTAMPNFALIHQQTFQKMENLKEYSERKKLRAQMLLSSNKSKSNQKSMKTTESKPEETKLKSSRQLFSDDTSSVKYNRFGFKMEQVKKPTPIKPISQIAVIKPVIKPSVFARADVVAIANKNTVLKNNKENRRDMIKGVRTNRRFELLMQMRNK